MLAYHNWFWILSLPQIRNEPSSQKTTHRAHSETGDSGYKSVASSHHSPSKRHSTPPFPRDTPSPPPGHIPESDHTYMMRDRTYHPTGGHFIPEPPDEIHRSDVSNQSFFFVFFISVMFPHVCLMYFKLITITIFIPISARTSRYIISGGHLFVSICVAKIDPKMDD